MEPTSYSGSRRYLKFALGRISVVEMCNTCQLVSILESFDVPYSRPTVCAIHSLCNRCGHEIVKRCLTIKVHSTECNRSHGRQAIDIAFALCGPNGGIVAGGGASNRLMKRPLTEGGQEVWDYFRRLRAKAWQKAGLDPDIVWTREQAIHFCNQQPEPAIIADEPVSLWSPAEFRSSGDRLIFCLDPSAALADNRRCLDPSRSMCHCVALQNLSASTAILMDICIRLSV